VRSPDARLASPSRARRSRYRFAVTDELHFASATWIANALRGGDISSVEIVDACLARIAQVNPAINAVVHLTDDARDRARLADTERAKGIRRGPLHGVPFTLKDSLDSAGVVTTAGTVGWRDRVPTRDATVAARLKAAGGNIHGKTNTPEFTRSQDTENDVYGPIS
jgi:Asp-tRNA(Asn)/Glu-tRNA(Gln) amidotransferase A subunit family amidase